MAPSLDDSQGPPASGEGLQETRAREKAQTYAALYGEYPFRDERYPVEAIPRPRHVFILFTSGLGTASFSASQ